VYLTRKIKKKWLSLNTVFVVLALLSALSLAELPLLHELHHHHQEQSTLSSAKPSFQSYSTASEKGTKVVVEKSVCPLCSIGGSIDQVASGKFRTNLFNHYSAILFAEPLILTGINYLYARQRAPPVV
jgi:hypothetical protein